MSSNYTGITSLEGLSGIRAKLSMYLGGTHSDKGSPPRALVQMLQETLSNALDEHVAGYGSTVKVSIYDDDTVAVFDEGRGLPIDAKLDAMTRAFSVPHSSGKFDEAAYSSLGVTGTHGVGMKAVTAASEIMTVATTRGDKVAMLEFRHGVLTKSRRGDVDIDSIAADDIINWLTTHDNGTVVAYKPDTGPISESNTRSVLSTSKLPDEQVQNMLRTAAFLSPGLTVTLDNKRDGALETFEYEGGLRQYLQELTGVESESTCSIEESIGLNADNGETVQGGYSLVVAPSNDSVFETYVNGVKTSGGSHVNGIKRGLLEAVKSAVPNNKSINTDDVMSSVAVVAHVQVPSSLVEFEGQTKDVLATSQVTTPLRKSIGVAFGDELFSADNDASFKSDIINNVLSNCLRRADMEKLKEQSKTAKAASRSQGLRLSSKLKKAQSRNPAERELYLVEGDSASNIGRDLKTQAVFPLRGKIINAFKTDLSRALKNSEVSTLVSALGAGILDEFDSSKLQYNKLIFACFTGDTRVMTHVGDGVVKPERFIDIAGRDDVEVLSMNGLTGETEHVTATNIEVIDHATELRDVMFTNGYTVRCTPDHMFLNADLYYVEARELKYGERIAFDPSVSQQFGHTTATIESVQTVKLDEPAPVYCLTAPGYGNFMLENGAFVKNCDRDNDGLHILSLLTGICFKLFPGMIEDGHVYVAVPPLYKATKYVKGKPQHVMVYSETEMRSKRASLSDYTITRFKGLGEMNESEARETLADPKTRKLVQLTLEDVKRAQKTLDTLIGADMNGRRQWVLSQLGYNSNDDNDDGVYASSIDEDNAVHDDL